MNTSENPRICSPRALLAALAFTFALGTAGLRAGDVAGVVVASDSRSTLAGASVTIVENGNTAVTDSTGRYAFRDLPEGKYTIRVQYLGYADSSQTVTIPAAGMVPLNVTMGSDVVEMQKYVVEDFLEGQSKALQQKRNAQNIRDIISADSAGNLPDKNVAEALSRVAGLNIDRSAGQGQFVTIRGIEPNYNSVTFNGNTLAAPGHVSSDRPDGPGTSEGRSMPLDVVSSSQISQIEVIKSVTPDMDGHALGGTINIKTASAFNSTGRIFQGSAETGYNEATKKAIFGLQATWGNRFGLNRNVGLVVSADFSRQPFRNDALNAGWGVSAGNPFIRSLHTVPKIGNRDRAGVNFNLEYRPNDSAEFYMRAILNRMESDERSYEVDWAINLPAGVQPTFLTPTSVSANRMAFDQGAYHDQIFQNLLNVSTGGSKKSGDLTVTGDITFSQADDKLVRDAVIFRSGAINVSPAFFVDFSDFYPVFPKELGTPAPDRLLTNRYIIERRRIREDTWTPRVDLKWDLNNLFGNHTGFLQTGAKFTGRNRSINITSTRAGSNLVTLATTGAAAPGIAHWDGRYTMPMVVDMDKALDYYYRNPGGLLVENLVDKAQNEASDTYYTKERILAPYAMGQINIGNRLSVLAGARFERTDVELTSFEVVVSGAGTEWASGVLQGVIPRYKDFAYNSFLPNLQVKYRLSDQQVLRFAVTSTFGRPPYEAAAAQGRLNVSPTVAPPLNPKFPYRGSVNTGNPDLQPFDAMNYDLAYEHYLKSGGILSLGLFYKDIHNPIYSFTTTLFEHMYENLAFEEITFNSKQNSAAGYVSGLEVNFQLPFKAFLRGPFDGFGINANATFMKSGATLNRNPAAAVQRQLSVRFFRQPDLIYNLALYYQKHRFTARLAYNFQGDSLYAVGASAADDTYMAPRGQYDVQASYKINDVYRVFISGQNLTDAPRLTLFGKDGRLRRGNLYGPDYKAGIRFNF